MHACPVPPHSPGLTTRVSTIDLSIEIDSLGTTELNPAKLMGIKKDRRISACDARTRFLTPANIRISYIQNEGGKKEMLKEQGRNMHVFCYQLWQRVFLDLGGGLIKNERC